MSASLSSYLDVMPCTVISCCAGSCYYVWCLFPHTQSIEQLEAEMLNGQKLQGPLAALEVHKLLKEVNHEEE